MTAATTSHSALTQARDQANAWLARHHNELIQRARYRLRRVRRRDRQEALAEVMMMATACVHSAAQRGRLDQVTAFWVIEFASRNYLNGRRAGHRSNCIMARAVQKRHGFSVRSLDEEPAEEIPPRRTSQRLREAIADRDSLSPFDQARIAHDYPAILDIEQVPRNGRRVFTFLAETHGEGRQGDMSTELKVTPARITQLKRQLGTALGRHGYHGPLGPRPAALKVEASTTGT